MCDNQSLFHCLIWRRRTCVWSINPHISSPSSLTMDCVLFISFLFHFSLFHLPSSLTLFVSLCLCLSVSLSLWLSRGCVLCRMWTVGMWRGDSPLRCTLLPATTGWPWWSCYCSKEQTSTPRTRGERRRQRERRRERQRDWERESESQSKRDTDTDRQSKINRQTEQERETVRARETDRRNKRDRQGTQRVRDVGREREK